MKKVRIRTLSFNVSRHEKIIGYNAQNSLPSRTGKKQKKCGKTAVFHAFLFDKALP